MLPLRIPLPRGTLKVKNFWHLRSEEREEKVPVLRVGRLYFVWRGKADTRRKPPR